MNTLVWSDETFKLQESSRRKLSVNKDDLSDCAKKGIAGKLLQNLSQVPLDLGPILRFMGH